MEMWHKGQLDANVAMQLLGQEIGKPQNVTPNSKVGTVTGGDKNENNKRPISSVTPASSSMVSEEVEECLELAKRAKMETWVKLCCIYMSRVFAGVSHVYHP